MIIYTIVYICLLLACVIYLYIKKPTILNDIYKDAEQSTRFLPTFFEIYDNSGDVCDRLIIVHPFNWVIWAKGGNVFVLDNTSGHQCPLGTTQAIRLTNDIFNMTAECISVTLSSLKSIYREPIRVNYDIENSALKNKFTVLDALNILFTKYISMNLDKALTSSNEEKSKNFINYEWHKNLRKYKKYKPKIFRDIFRKLYLAAEVRK